MTFVSISVHVTLSIASFIHRVQLNLNLTHTCTTLVSVPLMFARYSRVAHVSFYFTCEHTRVIQLFSNVFLSKFSKCKYDHKHKHKSFKTLLNTTVTYVCILHVSFVQYVQIITILFNTFIT